MKLEKRKPRFGERNTRQHLLKGFHKPQREHRGQYMPGDPRADVQRWDDSAAAFDALVAEEVTSNE